ncbi:MAG: CRISPR-associated protein Csx3 [bacterium]|nr:CRISPR-associated protein Csx3 [bacterium]
MLCNVNGAVVADRLIPEAEQNDPFLGVRPQHLRPALRLVGAVAKLPVVRIWNIRAAILASAISARVPSRVELYDVARGYVSLPDVTPESTGSCPGIEWEVIPLSEFTLVKWKNQRFITADDLPYLVPPSVDFTKPVVVANDGPPMWVHATLVRAYARAGVPWVGQFWPVESGRTQPLLGGERWGEVHPFAGPAVIVAGPDEKVGEMFPISFDLLRWGTPVLGRLASGELVVDRKDSHVTTHQTVLPLLAETLALLHSEGRESFFGEANLGNVVGENIRVETTDTDEIIFAKRPRRRGLTRFVKNRQPEPCSDVVVLVKRIAGGAYVLITAFIGTRCPAEPWDSQWATEQSVPFWSTHALVWGHEEVIAGTETKECPW